MKQRRSAHNFSNAYDVLDRIFNNTYNGIAIVNLEGNWLKVNQSPKTEDLQPRPKVMKTKKLLHHHPTPLQEEVILRRTCPKLPPDSIKDVDVTSSVSQDWTVTLCGDIGVTSRSCQRANTTCT